MPRSLLLVVIILFCSTAFLTGNLWAASSNSKNATKTKKQTELKPYSSLAKALKAAQKKTRKTAKISSKKRTASIKASDKTGSSKKIAAVKTRSPKKSTYLAKKSPHKTPRHKMHDPAKNQSKGKPGMDGKSASR